MKGKNLPNLGTSNGRNFTDRVVKTQYKPRGKFYTHNKSKILVLAHTRIEKPAEVYKNINDNDKYQKDLVAVSLI